MKKFRLLLLDANIVISLFKLGIWDEIVNRCDVHLARTVVEEEAQFYEDDAGEKHYFDLHSYVQSARVAQFERTPSGLACFLQRFDPVYLEKLDPGETETLAYVLTLSGEYWVCSADKIVYRILGALDLGEKGISLEEVLCQTGMARAIPRQFSKAYRETWTRKGFEEWMRGIGLKKPPCK